MGRDPSPDAKPQLQNIVPLVALYRLIQDQVPDNRPSLELVEQVINELADDGYLAGIRVVEEDADHYFKYVQFHGREINDDEQMLMAVAARLQKLSIADITHELNSPREKALQILDTLTNLGLLKHASTFLEGDQWYVMR